MAKISNVLPDDWLAGYIRNHVLDTLAPSERMQFRMACGRGSEALQQWANATLPKYAAVWRRLKSAERQRRFRSVPSTKKWTTDWRVAERTLGKNLTAILRRNRATLGLSANAPPADVLAAALSALDERLAPQTARISVARIDDAAHGPRGADSTRPAVELRQRTRNSRPNDDG